MYISKTVKQYKRKKRALLAQHTSTSALFSSVTNKTIQCALASTQIAKKRKNSIKRKSVTNANVARLQGFCKCGVLLLKNETNATQRNVATMYCALYSTIQSPRRALYSALYAVLQCAVQCCATCNAVLYACASCLHVCAHVAAMCAKCAKKCV